MSCILDSMSKDMLSKQQRYAVIDIGSNATRLHIAACDKPKQWVTDTFIRVPLPLGAEVFSHPQHRIGVKTVKRLEKIISAFQLIISTFAPIKKQVVATAAFRHATNAPAIIERVKNKTGVNIGLLSGDEEAKIIGLLAGQQFAQSTVINLDVGGGSTDCAVIRANRLLCQASFLVGTSHNPADNVSHTQAFQQWVKKAVATHSVQIITASGGSVAHLENLCGHLHVSALAKAQGMIKKMPAGDVARAYSIAADTVSYMEAAISIYKIALKSSGLCKIEVVRGGLSDALIAQMLNR